MKPSRLLGKLNRLTLVKPRDPSAIYVVKKILQRGRTALASVWNPTIEMDIEGRALAFPLSHRFPDFYSQWALYDRTLPRLCRCVADHSPSLCVIDVGANVGDTVNLIAPEIPGSFLCVEPSESYYSMLCHNTRDLTGVVLDRCAIGEPSDAASVHMQEYGGSAYVTLEGTPNTVFTTLDTLVESRHVAFKNPNVLKVDTDGCDYKVMRGAREVLSRARPAVFFEVAPRELTMAGETDIYAAFPMLRDLGYKTFLFYESSGLLLAPVTADDTNAIRGLVDFADAKPSIWLDVAAFHGDAGDLLEDFLQRERVVMKAIRDSTGWNWGR